MGIIQRKKAIVNKNKRTITVNVETYSSAQEVVNDCKARTITDSCFENQETTRNKSFTGVENYQEALDLLRNGYQPTVENLKQALKVNKGIVEKRVKFENNIHGFAPVVPLALKGVPNSMVNMTMKPVKLKVLDVYYDMTISCCTSTSEIIRNGQKVLGAIINLEKQGYRFNLYAVQTYYKNNDADMLCVKVKSSDRPLDLKRISFPLTHPAFFRVIGFDWYSKCPVAKYRGGYGKAIAYDLNAEERKEFGKEMFGDGAVYISCSNVSNETTESLQEVFLNAKHR